MGPNREKSKPTNQALLKKKNESMTAMGWELAAARKKRATGDY
jgi:hypothetical protein